ncbi:cysteine hydrolase family protein [Rothia halotolerans]|uniref:cysteine hydrolase family protein n=1 Tax=Rothia halotolerans TaxID=405770 RepID=UPI001EE067D1|nr:isochorismatase family cysteine hydrolase [Rothia halotolerans]
MKSALLIIDLQEGFFQAEEMKGRKTDLVDAANRLSEAAKAVGVPVFLITTEHSRDRSTWTLSMLDDGQGYLFHGDSSTELVEGLSTEDVTRVEKTRDSAWFATDLELRLKNFGVAHVFLAGVTTSGCIAQTARDAYARNVRTTIVTDAIADSRPHYQEAALNQLVEDRQVDLTTLDQVIDEWSVPSGPSF